MAWHIGKRILTLGTGLLVIALAIVTSEMLWGPIPGLNAVFAPLAQAERRSLTRYGYFGGVCGNDEIRSAIATLVKNQLGGVPDDLTLSLSQVVSAGSKGELEQCRALLFFGTGNLRQQRTAELVVGFAYFAKEGGATLDEKTKSVVVPVNYEVGGDAAYLSPETVMSLLPLKEKLNQVRFMQGLQDMAKNLNDANAASRSQAGEGNAQQTSTEELVSASTRFGKVVISKMNTEAGDTKIVVSFDGKEVTQLTSLSNYSLTTVIRLPSEDIVVVDNTADGSGSTPSHMLLIANGSGLSLARYEKQGTDSMESDGTFEFQVKGDRVLFSLGQADGKLHTATYANGIVSEEFIGQ